VESIQIYFRETKDLVEDKLRRHLARAEPLLKGLQESINYSLFSGGKRIRPTFCCLVGELFHVPREKLLSLACALEMIHTASLIMDDLPYMDSASMRRGQPANHLVFGQDVAALASIGLLAKAFQVIANDPLLPGEAKVRVISRLSAVVGIEGMAGGQFADLRCCHGSMEYPILEYVHLHKTASLFIASGAVAAMVGNAAENELQAVEEYAKNIGLAFQIIDDLHDLKEEAQEPGKSAGKGKGNFAELFGRGKALQIAQEYTNRAIEAVQILGHRKDTLIAFGNMLLTRSF
jgi:geranylgeranyl diphosphate synthase type II